MDHQWRHGPAQGNICPTCSISHFPFCPQHPSFDQNPRFQFENDHSFHRPGFDPYRGSMGPNNPNDGFGDPRYWHRNSNLGRDSYGHGMYNGVHRDGYAPMQYDDGSNGFVSGGDRNNKRMRIDEMGLGAFTNEFHGNSLRVVSEENERRLKLIRDHGGAASGAPQGGLHSTLGTSIDLNSETAVSEGNFSDKSFGEHGKFDDLLGGKGDIVSKLPNNIDRNNFRDPGFGSGDRRGSFFHSENEFNPHNCREEHGLVSGQRYMNNNRIGHKGLPFGVPNNVEQSHQGHDTDWGDNYYPILQKGDLNRKPHMSQHVPYPIPDAPNEIYHTHNVQQLQSKHSLTTKETQFSHHTNWYGSSIPYYQQRNNISTENLASNNQLPQPYTIEDPIQMKHDFHSPGQLSDRRQPFDVKVMLQDSNQVPVVHQNLSVVPQYGPPNLNKQGGYLPTPGGGSMVSENLGQMQPSRVFNVQPPLPASPPPPLPLDPPGHPSSELKASYSPPKTASLLFPVSVSSSSAMMPSSYPPVPDSHSLVQPYFHNKPYRPVSTGFVAEESHAIHQTSSKQYLGEGQPFPSEHFSLDKPKFIDASHLFKEPHRATRPDHIVIILRGLPGSGKSYFAKMLRDIEVENGGDAPRIHSMDDYFMTEVEKVEESEISKSSSSVRGKKPIMKKVMEYCYEPEMEEAYRSSMLKAFKKTLDEGVFTFVIVDDRNLRVADFAQFWAIAKRSGYEVYILEAGYKDPVGCAARNVHNFSQGDIEKMAGQWEETPSLYLQLDIKSLFHGDDLKESGIQEVDMDMEDGDFGEGLSGLQERTFGKIVVSSTGDHATDGSSKDEKRWDAEGDHPTEGVKELGRSKWSDDFDEDDTERAAGAKGNLNSLSGLIQAYAKEGKSVHWGDQVGNTGFSIGAAKKANVLSLVTGPGAGYNLRSNPLPEEDNPSSTPNTVESKRQSMFQERLRAESESFKAIFDKRRQRIGLDVEEEY